MEGIKDRKERKESILGGDRGVRKDGSRRPREQKTNICTLHQPHVSPCLQDVYRTFTDIYRTFTGMLMEAE